MAVRIPSIGDDRFTLTQLTSIEWIVVDNACDRNDPHRTIACVYQVDESEYDVVWLRSLDLPSTYMTLSDVLEDIRRATGHRRRIPFQKPIPIPHLAPAAATVS